MADIPAQRTNMKARRWADVLVQIAQLAIENPCELEDSGTPQQYGRDRLGALPRRQAPLRRGALLGDR